MKTPVSDHEHQFGHSLCLQNLSTPLRPAMACKMDFFRWPTILCMLIVLQLIVVIVLIEMVVKPLNEKDPLDIKRCIADQKGTERNPEFAIVICRGYSSDEGSANSFQRQLRQITVLLKSAAALTSRTLIFNIVSDSLETFNEITNITQSWPIAYRQRIIFGEYKEIFYPAGTEHMKNMFRPCATERLFLAYTYEEKDSLVFLDTDTLFLRPPEDLSRQIYNFESEQVIGIAPCLYYYGPSFLKFPTYGSSGLNAGVLLMNLTRIRNFKGGWTDAILNIVDVYRDKLYLADQDILNILFSSKARGALVYELGCEWNYRNQLCSSGRNKCKYAEKVGVGLLHGAALAFTNGKELKYQAVFEAWERHQMNDTLSAFATGLKEILQHQKKSRGCTRLRNVNKMLLKGLLNTIEEKGCFN